MNEQAPVEPVQPDVHGEIVGKIRQAAEILPKYTVQKDYSLEGVTRINSDTGYAQHSEADDTDSEIAIVRAEIEGSNQRGITGASSAVYSVQSEEGKDVRATIVKGVKPRDGITRAGSDHYRGEGATPYLYKHEFGPNSRDKAAKLITSMAIRQAAGNTPPVETVK